MNKRISILLSTLFFIRAGQINAQDVKQPASPVLIELFTSQGCSSCPPAEELLNTWGMALFKAKKALPLAFHVNYWDYLGWKDPFSSSFATARQRQYASFYNAASVFTPEMVVNGQPGFNGADRSTAQAELDQASLLSSLPSLGIKTKIHSKNIQVLLSNPSEDLLKGKTIYIVVFENDLKTSVNRGENNRRLLIQNFVVRYQTSLDKIKKLSIPIEFQWNISRLGVAVWAQDSQTMGVEGLNWNYPVSN